MARDIKLGWDDAGEVVQKEQHASDNDLFSRIA